MATTAVAAPRKAPTEPRRRPHGRPAAAAMHGVRSDAENLRLYARTRDPALRDHLVRQYLPLARQLAGKYRQSTEPFDDLVQVASFGLIKALDRFEPDRGIAFSSFAVPTIVGELKRHFRDRTWSVRVPRGVQERAVALEPVIARLTENGVAPSVAQLAEEMACSVEAILEAMQASRARRSASFSASVDGNGEDTMTLGDRLGEEDAGYGLAEDRATVNAALGALSERDREVLRLRFEEDLTQAEIGARIGVSQMQISRILRRSLDVMRAAASPVPMD